MGSSCVSCWRAVSSDTSISSLKLPVKTSWGFFVAAESLSYNWRLWWPCIYLAVLFSQGPLFFSQTFESNWTDIMEQRTRFLSTGWALDYSRHTHKENQMLFQIVHLEGSIKCSTSLLFAIKCDDYTCECMCFFFSSFFNCLKNAWKPWGQIWTFRTANCAH